MNNSTIFIIFNQFLEANKTVGLNILGLLITFIKFFTISEAAFSGTPNTVPSSNTPKKRSPPNRFKKEHTVS